MAGKAGEDPVELLMVRPVFLHAATALVGQGQDPIYIGIFFKELGRDLSANILAG